MSSFVFVSRKNNIKSNQTNLTKVVYTVIPTTKVYRVQHSYLPRERKRVLSIKKPKIQGKCIRRLTEELDICECTFIYCAFKGGKRSFETRKQLSYSTTIPYFTSVYAKKEQRKCTYYLVFYRLEKRRLDIFYIIKCPSHFFAILYLEKK